MQTMTLSQLLGEEERKVLRIVITESSSDGFVASFEYGRQDMIDKYTRDELLAEIERVLDKCFAKKLPVGALTEKEIKEVMEKD